MGNLKQISLITILALFTMAVYGQKKIKVVVQRYKNGNPQQIRYFNSVKDSKEQIQAFSVIGGRCLDKPISMITETYHENGKLQYRGGYKDGLATGLFEFYFESGAKLARSYYKNGRNSDSLLCFYPSGNLKRLVLEIDTARSYWHDIDYYESGAKSSEWYQIQQIDKTILEGSYQQWYENGQKGFEAVLKNNWTVGEYTLWDSTGSFKKKSFTPRRIPSVGEN